MNAPAVIIPVIQRGAMDCGVCCLQMLLDRPYDVIRDIALQRVPNVKKDGLTLWQIQGIARAMGVKLLRRRIIGDDDVGIVQIKLKRENGGGGYHYAVWFQGVIQDPADGMTWDADVYQENKGRIVDFLTFPE